MNVMINPEFLEWSGARSLPSRLRYQLILISGLDVCHIFELKGNLTDSTVKIAQLGYPTLSGT